MKHLYYSFGLAVMALFLCNCTGNKTSSSEENSDSTITSVETTSNCEEVSEQEVIDFITEFYNNRNFEDYAFLEDHCSPEMLKKLQDDYEYEGGGYAVWDFRTDAQDGTSDKHGVISVEPQGDDWYKYKFYDMGNKGSHLIKVVAADGTFRIEDLK